MPYSIALWFAYLLLAIWFAYSRRAVILQISPRQQRLEHALLGLLLLAQLPTVFLPLTGAIPHFGAREALALLTWLALLIYWSAAFMLQLEGLQCILLPVAVFTLGVSLLLPLGHATPWLSAPLMQAHMAIAMLAYGFFAVAAGLSLLMRLADRALHKPTRGPLRQLPPLLALEQLLFSTLKLGFALLTATLLTGTLFSEALFGQPPALNHKVVFSGGAWVGVAILLWGRARRGWRGKMAINWTLAVFGLLVLAYIGSRFVLDALLGRG